MNAVKRQNEVHALMFGLINCNTAIAALCFIIVYKYFLFENFVPIRAYCDSQFLFMIATENRTLAQWFVFSSRQFAQLQ